MGTFYQIWTRDSIFQGLFIDIFVDLFVAVNKICHQNNIQFVVFLGPILKDTFNERKFDFNFDPEIANGPFFRALVDNEIATYDLTCNLLSKYFKSHEL